MPYYKRRNRKRYRRKRPYHKKKGYRRANRLVSYTGGGLPRTFPLGKKFIFRTRYVETGRSLDVGALGSPVTAVYRLNSLYDPYQSGAGHQPLGFDQMMTMYDHYTVIGARARINLCNTDGSNPQLVIAHIKDDASVGYDIQQVLENGRSRWCTLSPSDGGQATKTMTVNFSAKKFFSKNVLQENAFSGDVSNNPSEQAYLHLTLAPADGSTDTLPVVYDITLEYIAVLTEPKTLASS